MRLQSLRRGSQMRRLNLQTVATTAIALLVFGAAASVACNEPATRATTATDAAADQNTPPQLAVTTGSGPEVDSSPATEPTAKIATAKNPTAEQQSPVQPVKINSPGPADDSVPSDGQPIQVATVPASPASGRRARLDNDRFRAGRRLNAAGRPARDARDLARFGPKRAGPGPSRRNHDLGASRRSRTIDRPSRPDRN